MQLFLTEQDADLSKHLELLKTIRLTKYDRSALVEKVTTISIQTRFSLAQLNTDFLYAYNIFPTYAMTHLTEWEKEGRGMQVGDTIVQEVYLPPLKVISFKMIVGVRIQEIFDEPTRRGFSYDTIEGHLEQGRATFTLEQARDRGISFNIHTFSRPANLLARIVGPIVSVPYQGFLTRLALNNVKRKLETQTA